MMTLGVVAKYCGVHKMTLYRMEKSGKLAAIGAVPRRLRNGTKERQFTPEQAEAIKRWREELEDQDGENRA
jgi:hypothetical protein